MKTASLLACLLLTPFVTAQVGGESPKPAPEMERLIKMWAGHWTTVEQFEPSNEMPQGKRDTGAETMRPGPGGLSLIGDYESHGTPFGHLVVTWIPKERVYKSYWSDLTQPGVSVSTGRWEGEKLVFTAVDESTGKKLEVRDTYSDITPTSFTDTLETGPLGGPMKKLLTVKYTKQNTAVLQKDPCDAGLTQADTNDGCRQELVPCKSIGGRKLFSVDKELVQSGTIEQFAAKDNGPNLLGVVNIIERIGIEQNQIGIFANCNRSL